MAGAALRFLICTEFALRVRSRHVEGAQLAGLLTLARPAAGMRRRSATSGEGATPLAPARGLLDPPCLLIKVAEQVAVPFVRPRIQPRVALGVPHQINKIVVRIERTKEVDSFSKRVNCQASFLSSKSARETQLPVVSFLHFQFTTNVDGNYAGQFTLFANLWLVVNVNWRSVCNTDGRLPSLNRALNAG